MRRERSEFVKAFPEGETVVAMVVHGNATFVATTKSVYIADEKDGCFKKASIQVEEKKSRQSELKYEMLMFLRMPLTIDVTFEELFNEARRGKHYDQFAHRYAEELARIFDASHS